MSNKYEIWPDDTKLRHRVTILDKEGHKIAEESFYFKTTAIVFIECLTADLKCQGVKIEFEPSEEYDIDSFGFMGMEWKTGAEIVSAFGIEED